jgi:hypothetical protein
MRRGGVDASIEECLQGDRTGYQPEPPGLVYWEEVTEGTELARLTMPITVTRCVLMASASRDFAPQHHNRDYAQQHAGAPDMFLGTHFNIGLLSRFLTDWGGPLSAVRRIKLAMRRPICPGEDVMIDGQVTQRYEQDGVRFVDVDIQVATQNGPAYVATATLLLPSREGT